MSSRRIGAAPRKVGREQGGRARLAECSNASAARRRACRAGSDRRRVRGVVEEGAEPGAADLRGRVGDRLQQRSQLELRRAARRCVQDLQHPRLFAQRLLGRLQPRDVAAGAGHVERRAVGVAHQRRLDRQPADGRRPDGRRGTPCRWREPSSRHCCIRAWTTGRSSGWTLWISSPKRSVPVADGRPNSGPIMSSRSAVPWRTPSGTSPSTPRQRRPEPLLALAQASRASSSSDSARSRASRMLCAFCSATERRSGLLPRRTSPSRPYSTPSAADARRCPRPGRGSWRRPPPAASSDRR